MAGGPAESDPLSRWLAGDGRATLDVITGEALDVIGVLDRDLTVRYINWTIPSLMREGVLGHSVLDLVPPSDRETTREAYLKVLRTGIGTRFETIYAGGEAVHLWDVRVG